MRMRHVWALLGLALVPVDVQAAPVQETLAAPGLAQPVEILKDHWGISHIYAKSEDDLFFAQGYNAARDRTFQLEMWRRQATGSLAEILGKKELKRDIANRLFKFRGNLTEELNWYHPHGSAIISAFVKGINAYIDRTERNPALLSPEFKMLGIRPGKWTPEIVISRFNGLRGNLDEEMNTALAVRTIGADAVKDLEHYQPADPDLHIDPAIDAKLLAKEILELYDIHRSELEFTPDELPPDSRATKAAALVSPLPSGLELNQRRADMGSNNWTVSGRLTESGYPILAGDPHRIQEVPSLRYWVHLNAPGWNVIGAGEPAIPGVSHGHNDFGAWAYTIYGADTEDLYVYDTNPANPLQYKYSGGWEDMKVIHETVAVKGGAPVAVALKYTRHGPILFEDTAHHKAYALRAAWLEQGGAPYLATLRVDQAHSWQDFEGAIAYARMPALNFVWADRDRNIGYQAAVIAPKRPNFSGLVPVPGDGRYEWGGFLPIPELPHVLNPEKGFYNTSNDYQIPPGYPHMEVVHRVWTDPYRGQSVAEVLSSGRKFTVADMIQLQNSDLSIPARSLVPLLHDLEFADPVVRQSAARLLHWNYVLDRDSVEAGIYEMFQRRLMANVQTVVVPATARPYLGMPPMVRIVAFLTAPDGRFGSDPVKGRNEVLTKSLSEAVAELTKRLGPDMEKWKLGAYHYAKILHHMDKALRPDLQAQFDVGPLPRGGDAYTITATGGGDAQNSGGSFKIISDTDDWDNSVGVNNPGQSGDVRDPHYRDLFEYWARGKYFPILFSRPKVESVAETRFMLSPGAN
ncbi:MAG TPA: penicillin acylase family protein [Rhizomicrobium sp.]|nr:penicillin acylase family protein [Rhizomicrobium sp.]